MDSQNIIATLTGEQELERFPKLARWLGWVVDACLYGAVVLIPLVVFPITVDAIELPKQTILLVAAAIGLLAWVGQGIALRKTSLARSWLHLVVVAFVVAYAGVAWFSADRFLSYAGSFGQMQWAVVSIAALAIFYLLIVNVVRGTTQVYHLLLAFLGSSLLVGLIGILQIVGVPIFAAINATSLTPLFNTIGSVNALGTYMTVPLILAASLTVLGCRDRVCVLGKGGRPSTIAMGIVWASLAVSFLVAVLVDYWVVWATILFGTVLIVAIPFIRRRTFGKPVRLIVPAVLIGVSIALLIFKTPLSFSVPSEVSPSALATWNIARQTLQEHPLTGSGPGTWVYDYAKFRTQAVNLSPFWSIRFERGLTAFLTLFAMIGLVGVVLWLLLLISASVKSVMHLVTERDDDMWQAYLTVFAGWATATFVAFVYNYNVAHHFVFWFFLALLGALITRRHMEWDLRKSTVASAIVSISLIFVCVLAVSTVWLSAQRMSADAKYEKSVQLFHANKPIVDSITLLTDAVALNRWNDSYDRNLSQAYLVRTAQEMQQEPTAERAALVDSLIKSALDSAKRATDITPANVDNWFNMARVLRSISSFTPGADEKAIEMYREALKREPSNPVFLSEIGELYILRSDAYRSRANSPDANVKKDAEKNVAAELDKAAEALNQSIQAKPDYATAHYDLALVYERQNRLADAITRLEQVLAADNKNVGVAFQLAILYYRNNEKDRSMNLFEQIVSFDPNYSNARWYLSAIYEERGRLDDAIAQVQKVKELNPGTKTIEDRLTSLQNERASAQKPKVGPLPSPVKEKISGQPAENAVQSP